MTSALRRVARRVLHRLRSVRHDKRGPVYLIAAAGQPNFGDEFITRAWLDWLAAHQPSREVWLDCMEPGRAAHLFRDTHPKLRTTNTLWQTAHTSAPDDVEEAGARMERLITELGSPKADFGLRALRSMRSLHLLGGGYMNTLWPKNLGIVAAMTAVKRHYGVPIFATGQGFLPHDEDTRAWMERHLQYFDYVEARDPESAAALRVRPGTDDAFLAFVNKRRLYAAEADLPARMVLIQGDDMFEDEQTEDIERFIDRFVASARSLEDVGFAEAVPPDDMRFASPRTDNGAVTFPFMRMWEEGFPARKGQEWLTSRFHFHMLAAAAGAQGTILNARAGYYDVKHSLLLELGTGWEFIDDLSSVARSVPAASGAFSETARRLGAQKALLARSLYGRPRRSETDEGP